MSKLKAVKGNAIYNDIEFYALGYGHEDGDAEFNRQLSTEYYLKADVDKVITELEAEIRKWKAYRDGCERQFQAQVEETGKYLSQVLELKNEIEELNNRHRLRKASEELPMDNNDVYVILENGFETTDRYDHDKGHWHYHWHTVKYWAPIQRALEDK